MDEIITKENEIINSINLFMNVKEEKHQFEAKDLIILKKIIHISDFDFTKLNKKTQRRLNIIFNMKKIFKLKPDLNNNKFFLLLIYNYIYENNKIPDFINAFYKDDLISFHTIFLFIDFFLSCIDDKEIEMNVYVEYIISIILHLKKIIKITKVNNNKKEINNDIHYLLEKIFISNNMHSAENIKFSKNLIKYPKIFSILKLCSNYYNNNILNDTNKEFILKNLKQLCLKNLNIEHANYLYSISKKFLKTNFINNNQRQNTKNYYSYINGIIEFFGELIEEEKQNYWKEKYFLFDSSEEEKGIMKTSPININNDAHYQGINLSFIFSFKNIKSNSSYLNNDYKKVILSVNDSMDGKCVFSIIIKNNSLYFFSYLNDKDNINEFLLLENIVDEINYLCFIYIDEIYFLFHNDKVSKKKVHNLKLKNIKQIYLQLGNVITNTEELKFQKFNGLIGPLLIFNSKLFNPSGIYQQICNLLKGRYYLLDYVINNIFLDKKEINFRFVYDEYYGISNINKNDLMNILNIFEKELGYPISYLNPEIIYNHMYFHKRNKFTDYQSYEQQYIIKNNQNACNYYEILNMKKIDDFIIIQKPFLDFFINNKLMDFILVNIEFIYNELLIFYKRDIPEEKLIIL